MQIHSLWGFKDMIARTAKTKGRLVKSKDTQNRVDVVKRVNLGHIPLFLQLAHKGLEKSNPSGENDPSGGQRFNVSKDLLALSVSKPEILENVERIDLVYQKPATSFGGRD